jgi:hypothetical protein
MAEITTIQISTETRKELKRCLSKAETYDEGIKRLILNAAVEKESDSS